MDSSKIKRDLGWSPKHTLKSGLRETVAWYIDHPEWVSAIRKQADYLTWVDKNYGNRK